MTLKGTRTLPRYQVSIVLEVTEMVRLMKINLDPETISLCCQLLEHGANPEALAALIVELQKEAANMKRNRC